MCAYTRYSRLKIWRSRLGNALGKGTPNTISKLGLTLDVQEWLLTGPAGEHLLVVDVALHPVHQVLDVSWCRHLGWTLVVLRVLPEIFEPSQVNPPSSKFPV